MRRILQQDPQLSDLLLKAFLMRRQLLLESGFTGARVVGSRFSRDTHRIREFYSRHRVPFTWIDLENDPDKVIVDFAESRVVDQSALQAIEAVAGKYLAAGKRLQLRHLTRDCHRMLKKAGHLMVDSDDDPDYGLAVDYDVKTGVLGGGH